MNNNLLKTVLYWTATIIILVALWPIIKWFILILLIFLVYIYFKFRKNARIHTFKFDDNMFNDFNDLNDRDEDDYIDPNDYDSHGINDSDDVIDVEVKVRDADDE